MYKFNKNEEYIIAIESEEHAIRVQQELFKYNIHFTGYIYSGPKYLNYLAYVITKSGSLCYSDRSIDHQRFEHSCIKFTLEQIMPNSKAQEYFKRKLK